MLDAIGIGLIIPVMPALINEVSSASISDAAWWGGLLGSTYALMQFLCGPLLGNLSDRFGRRPVLIISLFFMGLDYFLIAIAPSLWLLFIARVISGITGATYSTAAAYLSDTSKKGERAKNFGYIGGAFGVGFILGPVISALLVDFGVRMPFIIAGILALANAFFGFLIIPESLPVEKRRKFEWHRANPLLALMRIRNLPMIGSLMMVVFLFTTASNVYPSIWSFYTIEKFAWNTQMVSISLSMYGICAAVIQIIILNIMIKRLGVEKTATVGMIISVISLGFLTVVNNPILLFIGLPVTALGAIVGPALQGMMADQVSDEEQGEMQGVFASVISIAAIISPLLMSFIFQQFTKDGAAIYQPGAPFLAASIITVLALVVFYKSRSERQLISNK